MLILLLPLLLRIADCFQIFLLTCQCGILYIVLLYISCAGCSTCYVGETNRHLATRVREHLTSDKNSHIFQHINGSEVCRSLCSEDCFSILDTASMSFQLKIKEALHRGWEKPSLNKQVNHVNLTLSLSNTHCFPIIVFPLPHIHVVI